MKNADNQADESILHLDVNNISGDIDEHGIYHPILPKPAYFYDDGIWGYGFSQQGQSHVERGVYCQDRFGLRRLKEYNVTIAAVADGVGSCQLSDLGADLAIKSSLDYLECKIKDNRCIIPDNIKLELLREALKEAYYSVEKLAEEKNILLYTFQSTLTIALYDGNVLYYGHAGDDGIVALFSDGSYRMITKRHKGEEASSVYPLQSIETWEIGKELNVVALAICTDGVLDGFVMNENENNRIYFPFISKDILSEVTCENDVQKLESMRYDYMKSDNYRAKVTDDLTYILIVNVTAVEEMESVPEFDVETWRADSLRYEEEKKRILYGDALKDQKKKSNRTKASERDTDASYHEKLPYMNTRTQSYQQYMEGHTAPHRWKRGGSEESLTNVKISNRGKNSTNNEEGMPTFIRIISVVASIVIITLSVCIAFGITHMRENYKLNAESVDDLRKSCKKAIMDKFEAGDAFYLSKDNGSKVLDNVRVNCISVSEYFYVDEEDAHPIYFAYEVELAEKQGVLIPFPIQECRKVYGIIEVSRIAVDFRGNIKKGYKVSLVPYEEKRIIVYETEQEAVSIFFHNGNPIKKQFT